MKVLTCTATRRRLQAYHDQELPISDQVNVAAHLEWCDGCATALGELQMLRRALRTVAPGRVGLSEEESISLQAMVVSRAKAEANLSWSARLRELFDDMHMVYAGLGAGAATVACVMVLFSMMRFATSERSPGSNQNPVNPVVVDARTLFPRALDSNFMALTDGRAHNEDEAVYTLSAVVTREGRVVNLELHPVDKDAPKAGSSEAQAMKNVLNAIADARFEPARVSGLPVAVNMVWLVAYTTVRGTKDPIELPAIPMAKKRRADVSFEPLLLPRPEKARV
jgi:hypothetical protein